MKKIHKDFEKRMYWFKGSFTVEAAFVVPVLLGIAFVILYLLFLFHDRVVLQENGYQALCAMAEETIDVDSRTLRKEIDDALWIVQVKKANITKKRQVITGKVVAQVQWEIPVIHFFLQEKQSIDWNQKVSCIHPEEVVGWKKK